MEDQIGSIEAGKIADLPTPGGERQFDDRMPHLETLIPDDEYNFADTGVAPQWTFRFAVVPLL